MSGCAVPLWFVTKGQSSIYCNKLKCHLKATPHKCVVFTEFMLFDYQMQFE